MLKLRFRTKAGDAGGDANYEKSNAITTLPAGRFSSTYRTAILTAKRDTAEHRTALANALVDHICKVYGIPPCESVRDGTDAMETHHGEGNTQEQNTRGIQAHSNARRGDKHTKLDSRQSAKDNQQGFLKYPTSRSEPPSRLCAVALDEISTHGGVLQADK